MFERERWAEIWIAITRNKLRSALTMIGVSWGVFMLVAMLGMGKGLQNGVNASFEGWATNSMFIWTQPTGMPYHGFQRGRRFNFDNSDIDAIRMNVKGVDALAPRLQLGGWRGSNNVSYNGKSGAFNVNGDMPDIMRVQKAGMMSGRFLNEKDVNDERKVCVIGKTVVTQLFGKEEPLGKYMKIQGVYFQVIGTHQQIASAEMEESMDATIFIPFSTFQRAFNSMNVVHWFAITASPGTPASEIQANVKKLMAKRHNVDPNDQLAFGSFNMEEIFGQMNMLFVAIAGISWFVGLCSLIAGIIGIGNIMLVAINERTKEIGIRRSIGASPWNITSQIMLEAVTLTFIAGYFGLVFGVGLLESLSGLGMSSDFFRNPEVDLNVAIVSFTVLIVCGLLAGLFPAMRAVRIKAVDALRAE